MKSRLWQQRAVLFLLLAYFLDLAWKLAHWYEAFGGVALWGIALGLTVRFAFMGFIFSVYLRLKRAPQKPPAITRATKNASVRSMRIIHILLLAAIMSYILVAERLPRPTSDAPAVIIESFLILAILDVVIAFGFRRKLLPSAIEKLQRDAGDATALGRWRMANILSMVLAMSVALYGFALRTMGGNRRVVWPFFIASVTLMLLWRPRLNEGTNGTGSSPPPPN
jgi:hypothetical protein